MGIFNKIRLALKSAYSKVIEKIGIDKIAHCTVYGMVVAIAGQFGWIPAIVAFMAMWILSIIKEGIDAKEDWLDVLAGVIGGIIALAAALIAAFV